MSAQTVTLGADISALKRGMAAAAQLVAAAARRMSATGAGGLAGIGEGGAAALEAGLRLSGMAGKVFMSSVFEGSEASGAGIKEVTGVADFERTRVAFTTVNGEAARAEGRLGRGRELGGADGV